jgi:hypothetical protein
VVLGVVSSLIKKMAILVGLVEPQTYIGCRIAGNVGLWFCCQIAKKNAYDSECGRPDPFFILFIKIIRTSDP